MGLINFSGLASGIDSSSLIQAILDQSRASRIKPLQEQISTLKDTNTAFDDLTTLLDKLKTSASKFRSVNGGILSKIGSSSDETVATATAQNSANNGSFTLTVSALAKRGTQTFNDRFSSSSSAVAPTLVDTGNNFLTYTIGTGSNQETVQVEVTSSSTLDSIATEFNSLSDKAVASVINVGTSSTPSYAIMVTSNSEGTDKGQIGVSAGSDITTAGIFAASTLDQASNAQFTVSGVTGTITRSSNSVSDVFQGLTLNLSKVGSTTISVGVDAEATTATMQEFIDNYNELVEFINENDLITREENGEEVKNIFAPLSTTSLDNQVLTSIRSALSSAGISGNTYNILADLGVTTQQDGTLKFDAETFQEAVSAEPNSVLDITTELGESLASVNGTIAQYTRFNGLIDSSINANNDTIDSLNKKISTLEAALAKQEESLTSQFARLEKIISGMQSQQQQLASLIA